MSEEIKFRTEIQELLNLMIHSLYSNRDIFLRELIANSADAIDKARFESLTNPDIKAEWEIKIVPDRRNSTLRIADNGIGMTRAEVVENIGTIAKSGTKEYLEMLRSAEAKNLPGLIGQFGVGFYSAFMVSDKIVLQTRKAGAPEPAVRWESKGETTYVIEDDASFTGQGTSVTLHLKPDCKAYLEEWKIREIVKKYSDFIEHPVKLAVTKKEKDESVGEEEEVINSRKAIWLRPPSEVEEEEYGNFYSYLSHSDAAPLLRMHYSAEGAAEFKALLYVPGKAPFDLFFPEAHKRGLHLYIRRVFISEDCNDLLPEYLRFVKGVVESDDLPLNISREMLQDNPGVLKIRRNLVRKVLGELKALLEKDREKYVSFYGNFGRMLKEGMHTDPENIEKLRELLMFETLAGRPGGMATLKDYCDKMSSAQKDIYYAVGETRAVLENSPHLELLKTKGYDVLLMTEPIDEWIVQSVGEYGGRKLKAAGKGHIFLGDEGENEREEKIKKAYNENKGLLEYIALKIGKNVKEVRFSGRLTESACCLVCGEHEPSPQMERVYRALHKEAPEVKRVLELNPEHPLIMAVEELHRKSPEDPRLAEYAELLYEEALLAEGIALPDPVKFSKKVAALMAAGLK